MSDLHPVFEQFAPLPVISLYSADDEPTERLIPVRDPVEELRAEFYALCAELQQQIDAIRAELRTSEGEL